MAATWTKAVDGGILLPFFIVLSLGAPLIDSQICLPSNLFPNQLVELKNWYAAEFDDYLLLDPPAFFVNLVWFEILFIWPLSVACAYAVTAGGRSWFPKACLSIGVAVSTSMVAVMGDIMSSGKGSAKLLQMYAPFAGLAMVAIIRGLLSSPDSSPRKVVLAARKKKS